MTANVLTLAIAFAAVLVSGIAPTVAVLVSSRLASRNARDAQSAANAASEAATQAQLATAKAQEDAGKAQASAADAARKLVESAQESNHRLEAIQQTAFETKDVADKTHVLVNSQRIATLQIVAELRRRIANENPTDKAAAAAADSAEGELEMARRDLPAT